MSTLDSEVTDCNCLFENAMELWTTLQEDSNLWRLGTKIRETQQKVDEIRATAHTFVPVQRFACLQEMKVLQAQVEEFQCKEQVLKAYIQPCTKEVSQITLAIQEKLKTFQKTQRTTHLAMEGPTTKKLVEEVQQAAVESTSDLGVLNMEFSELCNKVEKPAE